MVNGKRAGSIWANQISIPFLAAVMVILGKKKEYAIKQLNYIWKKIIWFGDTYATGVIAITDYLNFDEINLCLKYAYNKNIIFCCTNNLNECKFLQGDY